MVSEVGVGGEVGQGKAHEDESRKGQKVKGVRVTPRDLDMLEFINDMKFAGASLIFQRFFRKKGEGGANSVVVAKNRLNRLRLVGVLEGERNHAVNQTFYRVTKAGVELLDRFRPMREHPVALKRIDHHTFDHDRWVAEMRVALEKAFVLTSWISERQLKAEGSVLRGLPEEYHPDAVFVKPTGERVAFEFENAWKSKDRYQRKVNRFVDILKGDGQRIFDQVHYVCLKSGVAKSISGISRVYEPLILVSELEKFLGDHGVADQIVPAQKIENLASATAGGAK